ncbi:MAG: 50S ribosomal protein L29 [bacterium]
MKRNEQLKELLKLSKDDLQKSLKEKQENLRVFRFDLAAGKVKDIRAIRATKRNIARIQTLIKT